MANYMDNNNDGIPDVAPDPALDHTPIVGASQDAKNRALRSFAWGLLTDLGVVAVLFLFPIFTDDSFDWTGTDWKVLALSFAKTVVVTVISYVARLMKISLPTTTA